MSPNLDRALLLMRQSRFEMAEQSLRAALAEDPDDPLAHAFLALCLVERKQYPEATREAGLGVQLGPGDSFVHYAAAKVLYHQDRLADAEGEVRESIRLDPTDPEGFSLLGGIQLQQRRWADALRTAEEGLERDGTHEGCVNIRAMALVHLGRKAEAEAAIEGTLAKDPENAFSHANLGWTLLHRGDHRKALDHFREALRLDPEMDWAKAGIVEALKARHLVYRLMLRFFLWMSRLSGKLRWAVILAIFFGPRILGQIGTAQPALAPFVAPARLALFVFVVLTWVADPLFNLLLRLNRFGRYALSRDQITASNWLGVCLLGVLLSIVALATNQAPWAWDTLLVSGFLMLPVAATFNSTSGGLPRAAMCLFTIGVAIAGLATVGPPYYGLGILAKVLAIRDRAGIEALYQNALQVFLFGCIFSTWAGLGLSQARRRA